ncbi:unnamed protein product [Amoebophrya sp. A120]|nr:unnamed protein product [Amoebophrya sp. A120]|eukprot:GSA120T00020728001.1
MEPPISTTTAPTSSDTAIFSSTASYLFSSNPSALHIGLSVFVATLVLWILVSFNMGNSSVADLIKKDGGSPSKQEPQPEQSGEQERPPKKQFPVPEEGSRDPNYEWTFQTLRDYDGDKNRMYIGVCGLVFDVQESDNFRPDFGYGKLWGGRDATYSLAMLSLKPDDAAKLDWKLEDLPDGNKESLKSWLDHFKKKYTIVGKLAEYDGWDFSPLDAFAKAPAEDAAAAS